MKKTTNGVVTPIALICINKSRLKVYHKEKDPTYYLQKGQEFQIELFNPTNDVVLAKIHLNGKTISQGGLILNPGQRVFLERYLDVAKKFMFDTYEVSNTEEVKKAIENNGDFKVEFYRESSPIYYYNNTVTYKTDNPFTFTGTYNSNLNLTGGINNTTTTYSTNGMGLINCSNTNSYTYDTYNANVDLSIPKKKSITRSLSKSIETGRVEAGSSSNQSFEYVNKKFDMYAFHTVEYKLLPVSQKINTVEDINVKRYCTNCGTKQKPEFKFCPSCGTKA